LVVRGGGSLELTGMNTYTGATRIEAGSQLLVSSATFASTEAHEIMRKGEKLCTRAETCRQTAAQMSSLPCVGTGSWQPSLVPRDNSPARHGRLCVGNFARFCEA
jgi:autotransporter-associated beta strand protein